MSNYLSKKAINVLRRSVASSRLFYLDTILRYPKQSIPILCDHKTGFTLTTMISREFNSLSIVDKNRCRLLLDKKVFYHFWNHYEKSQKYIVLVRDPREIIISGYLYHKKCNEKWAVTKGLNYYGKWVKDHFLPSEIKKNHQLIENGFFSKSETYQEILNRLPQEDGIIYEMSNLAYHTITGMYQYGHYNKEGVLTVKFEDLVFNFSTSVRDIFEFLEVSSRWSQYMFHYLAERHNLVKMKSQNRLSTHITNISADPKRYSAYWTDRIEQKFCELFPSDILQKLNYK